MVYIMNYCLAGDAEAEVDSPERDVEVILDMDSSPQFCLISGSLGDDFLSACKECVEEDYRLGINQAEIQDLHWTTEGWQEVPTDYGRSHQVFELWEGNAPDPLFRIARMVVQQAPLFGE